MPKKKAEEPAEEAAPKVQDQTDAMRIFRKEREAEAALIQAKADADVVKRKAVKPDHQGDIHQRMAALREDHIRMGARKE